ncbi:MAG: hypothetical protein HYY23_02995 [Verrucomicrobia bacterium]|nr:hypothetical protein [Verrucomicrobiota bacterium]
MGDRLILNNGSHRSFTLREMGVTRAPAVIQHVSSREELQFVVPSDVVKDPDRYLKHPRPSVMKDYFNPKLRKVIPSHRRIKQVMVN